MRKMHTSISIQLFTMIMSVAAASLFLSYGLSGWSQYQSLKKEMMDNLQIHTRLVGEYCIVPLTFEDKAGALEILKKFDTVKTTEAVQLYNRDGKLFAFHGNNDNIEPSHTPPELTTGTFLGGSVHVVLPVKFKNETYGTIAVQATTRAFKEKTRTLLFHLLFWMVILFFISGILAYLLQKKISTPIAYLTDVTKSISPDTDDSFRILKTRNDEIGTLYSAYNGMLDRLSEHEKLRDKAEHELRLGEQKFRNLVESITDCFWEVDSSLHIIYVSPIFEQITGYSIGEIHGIKIRDLFTLSEDDAKKGRIGQAMSNQQPFHRIEDSFHRKDGKEIFLEFSGTPILNEKGKFHGFRGIARDITEQRSLEQQLRQSQKMEAIGTLAGGIAHDFNNILSVILGYAELVKDRAQDNSMQEGLDNILIAGHRAKDLVAQILAFSRQSEAKRASLKLQPIIGESLKLLRSSIPSTITILHDIDKNCRPVMAEPTQIHQIIMNLCTNAYQAMEASGGELKISLHEVTLPHENHHNASRAVAGGTYAEIIVSDTGPGIDPLIQERIFEPFFTTKEVGKGTGMGLALVHGIIKGYAGTITLASNPEHSTSFHIYIPIHEKSERTKQIDHAAFIPRGTERILFVDDEPLLIDLGKKQLEGLGYTVTTSHDGVAALRTFKANPDQFDLIITDQTMPEMTGSELAEAILKLFPKMPIILCSGYSSMMSEKTKLPIRIHDLVAKPVNTAQLAVIIRKALDNKHL